VRFPLGEVETIKGLRDGWHRRTARMKLVGGRKFTPRGDLRRSKGHQGIIIKREGTTLKPSKGWE